MLDLLIIHSPLSKGDMAKATYQAHLLAYEQFKRFKLEYPGSCKTLPLIPSERTHLARYFHELGLFREPSIRRSLFDWEKIAARQDRLPILIPFDVGSLDPAGTAAPRQLELDFGGF
jgi:hypothetical protein